MASLIAVLGLGSLCALASPPDPAGLNPTHRISGSPSSRLSPGAVTVSGVLPGDTTWSGDVLVTGDVTVPAGATLTVAPGTVVRFAALSDDTAGGHDSTRCELIVYGNLSAEGTSAAPIRLTSIASVPSPGDWSGIRCVAASSPNSLVCRHAIIEYSSFALQLTTGDGSICLISSSWVRWCSQYGIEIIDSGEVESVLTIERSRLEGTGTTSILSDGIVLRFGGESKIHALITETTIESFNGYGMIASIYPNGAYPLVVHKNTIRNNGAGGCQFSISSNSALEFSENVISNNFSEGMHLEGEGNAAIRGNEFSNHRAGLTLFGSGDQLVTDNTFSNNEEGLVADGLPSNREVARNLFIDNTIGLHMPGSILATYNRFQGNEVAIWASWGTFQYIYFNDIDARPSNLAVLNEAAQYLDARFNHWDDATTSEMLQQPFPSDITSIKDIFDEPEHGFVDYADWLDQPPVPPISPQSMIMFPDREDPITAGRMVISGFAVAPSGILRVEISTDDGTTWQTAEGTALWKLDWMIPSDGEYVIRSRAVDLLGHVEFPGDTVAVTIAGNEQFRMGTIQQDENWAGEVILLGDVTVPAGITLTLEPGAILRSVAWADGESSGLDPDLTELIVQGRLVANGTPELPILFTSEFPVELGQWGGIRLLSTTGSDQPLEITLSHALLETADTGIFVASDGPTGVDLSDCQLRECAVAGLSVDLSGEADLDLRLDRCDFSQLGFAHSTYYRQQGGLILHAEGAGVNIRQEIAGCNFHDIEGSGISVETSGGGRFSGFVENSSFNELTEFGLHLRFESGDSSLSAAGNRFTNIHGYALFADGRFHTDFTSNQISLCDYSLLVYCEGNANFERNIISDNGYAPHLTMGAGTGRFAWNQIRNNLTQTEFDVDNDASLIVGCNVFQGNQAGIGSYWGFGRRLFLLNNLDDPPLSGISLEIGGADLSAPWNYWGPASTAEIQAIGEQGNLSFILDGHDYEDFGFVDISHWQSEPIPLQDAPLTRVTSPVADSAIQGARIRLEGYALAPEGVERVEVSADGGQTWAETAYVEPDLKELWTWLWFAPGDGTYTFRTRLVTGGEIVEKPGGSVTVTVTNATPINGDLNRDGAVDAADFDLLRAVLSDSVPSEPFDPAMLDMNGDGMIDVLDLVWLALLIAG